MIQGFNYAYSNYGSYARPADDGLSEWHPAYLRLGKTLDQCARGYEQFCRRYRHLAKPPAGSRWGAWRLWREIGVSRDKVEARKQPDLFAPAGARYRGGGPGGLIRRRSCAVTCSTRWSVLSPSISQLPERSAKRPMSGCANDQGFRISRN